MEIQFGPNAIDEPNLLYKLQRKIKVFNTTNPLPNRGYNLIASSAKYGVVFTASPEGTLSVYNLKDLVDKECEPKHVPVKLPESPTHITVSCDQELLAVIGVQQLCVYKITDFQNQTVSPSVSIKCEVSSATFVSALQWNPCIPDTIAIAFFDGTLLVVQVSTNQVKKVQSKARCLCWSPKGKQLVTGNSDGTLSQYKPDLTPAKMIPAPNLFESAPVEALAIYWISTFQFAVVYKNATDNSRPAVTVVNTPKAGQPSCLNYEDICYSMGSNRPWYYYLQGLAQWNLILSASSNSMEIATLASGDGSSWTQWCQNDEARPELPLTDKKQENYPVGICIDTSAIHQLPWGENETLPFMPLLLVVSQTGLLTLFNVINLNKAAAQVCTPPQSLALPAAVMISDIPGQPQAPPQAQAPPSVMQPKAQIAQSQPAQPFQLVQSQSSQPAAAFAAPSNQSAFTASLPTKPPVMQQQQPLQNQLPAAAIPQQQQAVQKPPEVKPVAVTPQPLPPSLQQTQPSVPKPQPAQAPELNATLKAEQERANRLKVDQELKGMLVKEVNDFQMELYNFELNTRALQNKLQRDIDSIDSVLELQTLDTQQLKKECSLEELRSAVIQLKLELVRACALLADARTHAQAKTLDEWTQADPLTTKRVANIKKLAYYVQTQLDHAHRALDFKWNEINRDAQYRKPGQRMIRPILDDVYQPLVRQQEILARQQGVLRALRGTLQECTPRLPTALLRLQTKDPLSKLTKNILNMSIEPQPKSKENLTAQKLDALRDMLSNHRPVKIKPVHVELRRQLAAMRLNYERSVKETKDTVQAVTKESAKVTPVQIPVQAQQQPQMSQQQPKLSQQQPLLSQQQPLLSQQQPLISQSQQQPLLSQQLPQMSQQQPLLSQQQPQMSQQQLQLSQQQPHSQPHLKPRLKAQHVTQTQNFAFAAPQSEATKAPETKPDLISKQMPISVPSFTPVGSSPKPGFGNVARTLFTDEPKSDTPKLQPQPQQPSAKSQNLGFAPTTSTPPVSATTRSVLKEMLENKQANAEKNDSNTFMGQKICSPTVFGFSSGSPATTQPALSFTSKPISDINNMFSKFTPQAFSSEPKSPTFTSKPKSEESGEVETTVTIKVPAPKPQEDKPITNLFAMKSSPQATSPQNVPDVLKSNSQTFTTIKPEAKPAKFAEKVSEESKENAPEKPSTSVPPTSKPSEENKESGLKLQMPSATQASIFGSAVPSTEATAPLGLSESNEKADIKVEIKTESAAKPSEKTEMPKFCATSLFAAANASTPVAKVESSVPSTPTPTSSPTSIFASSPLPVTTKSDSTANKETPTTTSAASIFGTALTSQPIFGNTTTAKSLFTSATTSASVFGTSSGSIFGSTTGVTTTQSDSTASSVFGTSTTQSAFGSATAKPSVFSTPTPASPASVFGSNTTATTGFVSSPASVFATANASTTSAFTPPSSPQSLFGSAVSTTQSVFGTATTTSPQSIFGAAAPTTQPSLFGTSSSPSVFGAQPAITQASVFGSAPITQASVFGAPATSQSPIFGSTSPTTQASVFGSTQQASIFGSSSQPGTQTSLFGTPQTTQASIFGSATPTTQTPVFGTPPATTTQSGSLFGGGEANLFAAASISTTSASSPSSTGSIFGGASSVFGGSGTSVFGSKPAFGQAKPANVFGGGTSFLQKTDAPAQNFWGSGSSSGGSGFGSSGFGQQATTQASSIFGGVATTGGSFSSPSSGPFGSPQQTQASVFGTPPQQQTTSAFGGSPAFGSKPAFGQPAGFGATASFGGFNKTPGSGFGASASFGGGATFGGSAFGSTSPGKMFGGGSPAAATGFGTPTQSNATFENLATQNTLTFGNLAQQTPPAQPAPSFNTSPSFTGWRG